MLNTALRDAVTAGAAAGADARPVHRRRAEQRRQGPPRRSAASSASRFPDTYTLGMSHHGLQVLYTHHEQRPAVGLRAGLHARGSTSRAQLRRARPAAVQPRNLHAADRVRRGRLQPPVRGLLHERPDDARPRRHPAARRRTARSTDPLVIAGGPGAQNPELLAPFIDLFVIGDGEESLPWRHGEVDGAQGATAAAARATDMLAETRRRADLGVRAAVLRAGVPRRRHHRRHEPHPRRRAARDHGLHHRAGLRRHPAADAARSCRSSQTPHDRIAIEIMRGCPWQCRFCQSTVIKRPLRVRSRRDHRAGRARELPQHRPRRDQPAHRSPPATTPTSRNW